MMKEQSLGFRSIILGIADFLFRRLIVMKHFFIMLLLTSPAHLSAQKDTATDRDFLEKIERFSLSGYGAMNYYNFNWQTDSVKRNAIDNERFILDLGYRWTDKIKLNTEIEFEHGGTGVDVEFDRFEEFGEFEFDISKGGEVLIEQMNLEFVLAKQLHLKVGRVKVPFALMFSRDEPTDYLTATTSEMETQILPTNWTENGLLLKGRFGQNNNWQYHFALVNGLDGSAFNSANWIKRGNQRRFEMVNAENFALSGRLDFHPSDDLLLGLSAYGSNTTGNRPKPDLKVQTPIGLAEFHFQYEKAPVQLSGMVFYGALGNSEALSNQNRNLSNNLNVKRTPVGASAVGIFIEAGAVLIGQSGLFINKTKSSLLICGRFDYYDTMFETEGVIFNNPRWARHSWTAGATYKIIEEVHFKTQYTIRTVGAPAPTSVQGGRRENTFVAGFAFEF
jgi:hypothetical protein